MKYMLSMATTFLAVTSPVFGMDVDEKQQTRTITVIADLDMKRSQPLQNKKLVFEDGHFDWYGMPKGYKYDSDTHTISFNMKHSFSPLNYPFDISYAPRTGKSEREAWYSHDFKAEIPAGGEDIIVQATLLSIVLDCSVGYGSNYKREKTKIYELK